MVMVCPPLLCSSWEGSPRTSSGDNTHSTLDPSPKPSNWPSWLCCVCPHLAECLLQSTCQTKCNTGNKAIAVTTEQDDPYFPILYTVIQKKKNLYILKTNSKIADNIAAEPGKWPVRVPHWVHQRHWLWGWKLVADLVMNTGVPMLIKSSYGYRNILLLSQVTL